VKGGRLKLVSRDAQRKNDYEFNKRRQFKGKYGERHRKKERR
jgi:hypothetical protein